MTSGDNILCVFSEGRKKSAWHNMHKKIIQLSITESFPSPKGAQHSDELPSELWKFYY